MGLTAILVLVSLFHVAAVVAGVYLDNLFSLTGTPYYGGDSGPLPGRAAPTRACPTSWWATTRRART